MTTRRMIFSVLLIAAFIGCVQSAGGYAARTLYVDDDGNPGGDGYSWASALPSVDVAAAMAKSGDEILVAAGTYKRNASHDRPVLRMARGVAIYGGFGGESVLDGQGRAIHVVEGATGGLIDGFTITGGAARFTWPDYNGGGMENFGVTDLVVSKCQFINNSTHKRGGAVYNNYSEALFVDCDFINNTADVRGGGICNHSSTVEIVRCRFVKNFVTSADLGGPDHGKGGAVHSFAGSWTRLLNCVFTGNFAPLGCPDIFTDDTSETIVEVTP